MASSNVTFMMRSGNSTVFAAADQPTRDKLRRRGWERVTRQKAAATLGSGPLLEKALETCSEGEIERVSELDEISFQCHRTRALDTASTAAEPAQVTTAAAAA